MKEKQLLPINVFNTNNSRQKNSEEILNETVYGISTYEQGLFVRSPISFQCSVNSLHPVSRFGDRVVQLGLGISVGVKERELVRESVGGSERVCVREKEIESG